MARWWKVKVEMVDLKTFGLHCEHIMWPSGHCNKGKHYWIIRQWCHKQSSWNEQHNFCDTNALDKWVVWRAQGRLGTRVQPQYQLPPVWNIFLNYFYGKYPFLYIINTKTDANKQRQCHGILIPLYQGEEEAEVNMREESLLMAHYYYYDYYHYHYYYDYYCHCYNHYVLPDGPSLSCLLSR